MCSGKCAENFTNVVSKQSIFKWPKEWPKEWPGQNTQNNSSWPLQLGSAHQTHCFLQLLKTTARQLEDMTVQAKEFFDVKGQCQDSQGNPSQKSVKSISHLVEGLRKINGSSNEFDPELKDVISMKSLTTMNNEYFNGILRDFNPTLKVLDVSRYFVDACEDTHYTLVWAGSPFFTREKRG